MKYQEKWGKHSWQIWQTQLELCCVSKYEAYLIGLAVAHEAEKKLEEVHEKFCEFRGEISLYRRLQHLARYEQKSGRSTELILNLSSSALL
jgi:hypothetical protein